MLFADNLFGETVSILLVAATGTYLWLKWGYMYWERHNFPFLEPQMLFGNLENPFTGKSSSGVQFKVLYDELKAKGAKHGGVYHFWAPVYIPIDLEYIRNVLSEDFQYFSERGCYYNKSDDPLSVGLFNVDGAKWKELRKEVASALAADKIKMMFPSQLECGEYSVKLVEDWYQLKEALEVKDFANKFAAEVMCFCVFGQKCGSNSVPEFCKYMELAVNRSLLKNVSFVFASAFPSLSLFLGRSRLKKKAADYFMKITEKAIESRESSDVRKNDILQILVDLRNNVSPKKTKPNANEEEAQNFTTEELAAQAVEFLVSGFDTIAAAISFSLYELANNTTVQKHLRKEVFRALVKHEGKLTYEGITDMKYMQQVLEETLRKYPPVPLLKRECVKTYKIPDTDLVLEEGTQVIIPLLGLHHDEEHYPWPGKFDPERFSPAGKIQMHPFSYLPFGGGPGNCTGASFAMMQVKTALVMLVKNYKFSLSSKTYAPLETDLNFVYSKKEGIWLDVDKIN